MILHPRLASIRCRDYLPFHEPVEMELRPLTLILGRNNSGKSALLRLIRLALRAAAQELQRDGHPAGQPGGHHVPLTVDGVPFAARFVDLVYGRLPRTLSLGLSILVDEGPCAYDAELIPVDTSERCLLNRLTASEPGISPIEIELDLDSTSRNRRAIYRGPRQPKIEGLFPAGELVRLRRAAATLDSVVSHLGPLRARVPHVMQRDPGAPLGHDGAGAPHLVARDSDLADHVDRWFRKNLGGARVQVSPLADAFSLATTTLDGVEINLAQAGEGLHQVLPIVVQQLAHRLSPETTPVLDLVEQPELHLHDNVHAPLADLFLDTVRTGCGAVVVETHSEGLLLRVRLRIAEGKIPIDDVAIYFVDRGSNGAVVRRVGVNRDGELSHWPEGVFLEGYREVLAIQRAIRDRKQS